MSNAGTVARNFFLRGSRGEETSIPATLDISGQAGRTLRSGCHFKRMTMIDQMFGDADGHLAILARLWGLFGGSKMTQYHYSPYPLIALGAGRAEVEYDHGTSERFKPA